MQHTSRGRNLLLINIRLYIFILDLDSAQKSYEYIRILCVELSINREKKGCVLYRENKRYREMKRHRMSDIEDNCYICCEESFNA